MKQAEAGPHGARAGRRRHCRADKERDEALANVAALESELAVLREVVAERDRLLQEVRELRAEARCAARAGGPPDRHRRHGGAAAGHEGGAEGSPGGRPPASDRTAGSGPP